MVDRDIREALLDGKSESQIRQISRSKGYWGLLESGVGKLLAGMTTAEQVLTTAYTEDVEAPVLDKDNLYEGSTLDKALN